MNYQNPNIGSELNSKLRQYFEENNIASLLDIVGKVKYNSK